MDVNGIYKEAMIKFEGLFTPLLEAMMMEACESVAMTDLLDDQKSSIAIITFYSSLSAVSAVVEESLNHADIISLKYRGQEFELSKASESYALLNSITDQQ